MTFTDWLAAKLGTRNWVVARASAKRRLRYDLFLSQARFTELRNEFNGAVA